MTFEEFLRKKKIDLPQFESGDPQLLRDFRSLYIQMGEKSFDHSKKFLFNKLRRTYHLKEEPKPIIAKETIEINEIASQAEPLISPTVEATVYTPRFRAGGKVTPIPNSPVPEVPKTEKPSYVPRFKAQPAKSSETGIKEETPTTPSQPAKPAFKPRFKPGLTGTAEAKQTEEAKEEIPAEITKTAYVPRFRTPALKTLNEPQEKPAGKAKTTYVPRFKSQVTKKPTDGTSDETGSD